MTRASLLASAALLFGCAAVAGCAAEIGDHCATNDDCPNLCRTGGGFPGGICTLECDSTEACPSGWVCISDSSGICMLACNEPSQCSDRFGAPWTCRSKSLEGASGDAMVCFGP